MSLIESSLLWAEQMLLPYGEGGLFLLAFAESSFFPIPPDALLIPLALLVPSLAIYYALITTIGSVLGAVAGYYLGKTGRKVKTINSIFQKNSIKRVESYFKKYGAWAVGISAFTPIPYKIFTILAGMIRVNLPKFVIASIIGRGARFLIEAVVIMFYGEQILGFLITFELATIAAVIIFVGLYAAYLKYGLKIRR